MDKLTFGTYDSENTDCAFNDPSYVNPITEQETRKQLSYPLKELKTYINDTVTIDSNDKVVQLKLDHDNNALKYSLDHETWNDLDFYGEQGSPGEGVPAGGNTGNIIVKKSLTNYDTEWKSVGELFASDLLDKVYPIGAIYLSVVSTSPDTLIGGTWEQIEADAYLKIVTTDGGELGGTSEEHKIPVTSMPSHNHSYSDYATYSTDKTGAYSSTSYINQYVGSPTSTGRTTSDKGGGQAYYPYYLGVYVWKRTA